MTNGRSCVSKYITSRIRMTTPIGTPSSWCFTAQHVQEELSYAYVHAVCYMAGCKCERTRDDQGIDAKVSYMTKIRGLQDELGMDVHLQLKATYRASVSSKEVIYDLDADAYTKLRRNTYVKRFLVLFVMPPSVPTWITSAESFLVLRHCAYWYDLRGMPETDNSSSRRIKIPRSQLFDQNALLGEMQRLASRGDGQ